MRKATRFTVILVLIITFISMQVSATGFTVISGGAQLGISAHGAVVVDLDTDSILYSKNMKERCYPASLTKMMTLLVAYENTKDRTTTMITVPKEATEIPADSSTAWLLPGDGLSINDLFYAMMLPSGNDAAITLATAVAGSQKAFIEMMNKKAVELGMTGTHFENPHGYHNDNHYTTPYDLALLSEAVARNPELVKVTSAYKYKATIVRNGVASGFTYTNSNSLLDSSSADYLAGIRGLKTGYTSKAGNCLATYYEKDSRHLVCVITNTPTGGFRSSDTQALIKYGVNNFVTIDISQLFSGKTYIVDVENAAEDDEFNGQLELYVNRTSENKFMTVNQDIGAKIKGLEEPLVIRKPANIKAPIMRGDNVGELTFLLNGEIIYTADARASRNISSNSSVPGDLESLGIQGTKHFSLAFVKTPDFYVPTLIIIAVAAAFYLFVRGRRRREMRLRYHQRNIVGRTQTGTHKTRRKS